MLILQCADETEEQATGRVFYEIRKRKELAGYVNGSFIFKGRRCVDQTNGGPLAFVKTSLGSGQAKADAELRLERDRRTILKDRAVREAADHNDLFRLLALYGV